MSGSSSTRSTGSATVSRRSGRRSLRTLLTAAFVAVALVSILAAAVSANLLAKTYVNRYFRECAGHQQGRAQCAATSEGTLDSVNRSFLVAVAAALVLGLAMSVVLARELTRPIEGLRRAADRIAGGDYSQRVEVRGGAEIEELGDAFNALAGSLETNERLRRNMAADVAHELRNPLASIAAQLEAVRDGVIEPDAAALASIAEDVDVLARLVDDLQQLSLAEAGGLELARMDVDTAEMLEGVAARFSANAESLGVALGVEVERGLPPVDADPVRVAQVLANLVINALVHTPAGGRVTLAAVEREGGVVGISVADSGCGIAPGDLPFIFERFYRAERARERATGGAGIGLAVARSIVEAHGGTIHAASEEGKGTVVTFTLPVSSGGGSGCKRPPPGGP